VQDESTGLQYFGARYYDPAIGRFMGVDAVGFSESNLQSFNRFAYGNNNPYLFRDADGKFAIAEFALLTIGLIEIAVINNPAAKKAQDEFLGRAWKKIRDSLSTKAENSNEGEAGKGDDAQANGEEGCIYCVPGKKTSSGKDYVGRSDDWKTREKVKSDGRDREGAEVVDTYPKGNREVGRIKEQQEMNKRGGVDNLDNKRNEVAPKNWPEKGIDPP
jgi:RHS repeat-associated protein